nr:nuclear hormone receptor HR96-like [Dermatophagoides farinae]
MARKIDKTIKLCVICGDKAKGINFNVLTCMSCKAFFRRNALRKKDMKCPFNDACQIDKITRKFCSKCRLKKCFESGMKKEWILSDEEKRLIKEKILRNKIRKQQLESERKQQQRQQQNDNGRIDHQNVSSMNKKMTTTSSNGRRRRKNGSIKTENTTTVAAAVVDDKNVLIDNQQYRY